METNIAILNGNGIHNLAQDTRSRLHLEGYKVVAINNFRDFGVDRTVICCRPERNGWPQPWIRNFSPGRNLSRRPGWLEVSMSR